MTFTLRHQVAQSWRDCTATTIHADLSHEASPPWPDALRRAMACHARQPYQSLS